jgi:heterodisulfide reductase subunit A-like polyferredoxin
LFFDVAVQENLPEQELYERNYQNVTNKQRVLIIGAGPAGLFAALELIELGYKPVIIERGKRCP